MSLWLPRQSHALTTCGRESPLARLSLQGEQSAFASAVWPADDLAIYVPITLEVPYRVRQLGWMNGTAVAGNADCGIYSHDGRRLISTGATATSGTSTNQLVDVADTDLAPGAYYLALWLSRSTTGTIFRRAPTNLFALQMEGCLQESVATNLPATMTPASLATSYYPFMFAVTGRYV